MFAILDQATKYSAVGRTLTLYKIATLLGTHQTTSGVCHGFDWDFAEKVSQFLDILGI